MRWAHLPGFLSLTLRRESTQLDELKAKARELYSRVYLGLKPVQYPRYVWRFPSGAESKFGHCQNTNDFEQYDGWEINLLQFDELTHFTERQYLAICARVRSSDPKLPCLIRSTTNPGGVGHEWVLRRWGAWLDPEFKARGLEHREGRVDDGGQTLPPADPGEVWWVRVEEDGSESYFAEQPTGAEQRSNPALSRTFIPSRLEDNPHLAQNDSNYVAQLNTLDPVRRAQLRDGNWLVRPGKGAYFKRSWVTMLSERPSRVVKRVRYWDLAATAKKQSSDDPDWTAGVLMSLLETGEVCTEDVVWIREQPGEVEKTILNTAVADGTDVHIGLPQDPGQAGKFQLHYLVQRLRGFRVDGHIESGDKVTRFGPYSSYVSPHNGGNGLVVAGGWNTSYFQELEAFPEGKHDDQVDATSGAFGMLIQKGHNYEAPSEDGVLSALF